MDLTQSFMIFLIPVAFLIGGLIMWKATPKKNFFVGWRTKIAMKSEENFKIANKCGGKATFLLGAGETIIAIAIIIANHFVKLPEWTMLYTITIQSLAFLAIIIMVEIDLRKKLK